jgi:hypothetical protein
VAAVAPAVEPVPESAAPVAPAKPVAKPRPKQPEPRVASRPTAPKVVVEGTVWHPSAARRTATVSLPGRDGPIEVREGDSVGKLVVRRIEPAAVVFSYAGTELRRRVGAR